MKKLFSFLRSMRFGLVLLGLIAALSVAGSVIPQERALSWYVEAYPTAHPVLLLLQLHRVFKSWYFLTLLALLCLNLVLCSLLRFGSLLAGRERLISACAELPGRVRLTPEGLARLEQHLQSTGCRRTDCGETRVYSRALYGRWGSFVTHLAILLTVLVGAAALALPTVIDLDCLPGETLSLPAGDGGTVKIAVSSFRVSNASGQLDYTSALTLTLPDGRSRSGEVSVNHPLRCGSYKIYQQSYGTAGSVTVTNLENDGSDDFALTDLSFLSLDNQNGVWFVALYPDHLVTPAGELIPVDTGDASYPNPVYYVQTVDGEDKAMRLLLPGDSLEIGPLRYRFNEPVQYPGLRIKRTPAPVNALLIACFALMTLGLWLLFFRPPVLVKVDGAGYAVGGPKPEGMRLELKALLRDYEEDKDA